jgi:tripartite-type tricarboxylate transporter receptor subunit TctC
MMHYSLVTPHERKRLVHAVCGLAVLVFSIGTASAQPYPAKPIRLIVGSAAGGGGDAVARVVSQPMTEILAQPVIVDNRPGSGGNIGADFVAKSPPDGYTLLLAYTGHVINPGLFAKLPFDTLRDFAPVTMLATNQTVLAVHPSVPAKSVKELIALARAKPGRFTMGALPGSTQHLAGELFKSMAKVDMLFIPFKGNAQALTSLLSGEVDVLFNTMSIALPHVKAGKMRALAVTGKARSQLMPELPTIGEAALPGFSSVGWYGIVAPAKTPAAVVEKLNQTLTSILKSQDVRQRFINMGNEPIGMGPKEFDTFIREEIPRWSKVIRDAKIKLET